jgi:6-phosphogluconate dehydrogenase
MQIGMIGLGRMGASMALRLARSGHECVVYDTQAASLERALAQDAQTAQGGRALQGTATLAALVAALAPPRALWLMVPAGGVDDLLRTLSPLLARDDTVIDGGNSYYHDDIRRAGRLREAGIHHLDVGTSGGVAGLERGYCLMIGGEPAPVQRLVPVFEALAPGVGQVAPTPGRAPGAGSADQGWLHCGPHGAGHFVKMVHNGIEYGLMAAYAEGLNVLRHADIGHRAAPADAENTPLRHPERYRYAFDIPQIAELWRRGSVIGSWLLDLSAAALAADPDLHGFQGRVSDSGEGRWTVQAAIDEAVPVPVLSAALYARFASRGGSDFANRLLSAMRHEFGGHDEQPADAAPARRAK